MRSTDDHHGLTPVERERYCRDVGSLRADRDGLLAATRGHRQIGGEALTSGRNIDAIAGGAAGNSAGCVPAGFAPRSGNRAAAILNLARQIEIIAFAGASKIETKLG